MLFLAKKEEKNQQAHRLDCVMGVGTASGPPPDLMAPWWFRNGVKQSVHHSRLYFVELGILKHP